MRNKILSLLLLVCISSSCSNPFDKNTCELNEAEPALGLCDFFTAWILSDTSGMTDSEIKKATDGVLLICVQAIIIKEKCDKK